jgi:hypothetical protein
MSAGRDIVTAGSSEYKVLVAAWRLAADRPVGPHEWSVR